jgi:hypothetical protein
MNDAAVVEDIEPDLVEQTDVEEPEQEVDIVDEDEASEAEETDEETKAEDEPSESSTEKKGDSFQERIDELTGKFRSEERARIEAETRYQQMQQRLQTMEQAKPIEPGKTLADFDYDEGAFTSYLSDVAQQAAQEETRQRLEQDRNTERQIQFKARESEFSADIPDYELTAYHKAVITPPMAEVIQSAEKGPELAYYLGKNPEVGQQLAQMAPLDMARELGRIEATKLVPPEKPESKTPPPPPKLKAGNAPTRITSDSPESDKLSDSEWLKRERKRLAARNK